MGAMAVMEDTFNIEDEDDFSSSILDYRDLSLSSSDWTVETLFGQMNKGNIDVSPEFQRRQVWDANKQTAFIESLILGIPVPQIVIAQNKQERGKYIVLDGKQRLLSITRFYDGDLRLGKPELLKELKGLTYGEMDDVYRDAIDNSTIRAVRISGWNNDSVLYTIFHRLNSGSVSLNTQELRFALMPGPFTRFASSFTDHDFEFARLFSESADGPDFRMRDIELLTRYCGIVHRPDLYTGNLKEFLDQTTAWLNDLDSELTYQSYADEAVKAISLYRDVYGLIGANYGEKMAPFALLQDGKKPRFNRAVFDALCFAAQDVNIREAIASNKKEVATELGRVLSSPGFIDACSVSTKTKRSLIARVAIWSDALSGLLGIPVKKLALDKDGKVIVDR